MTSERWRQIQDIFDTASALDGADREAYLDLSCADDRDLRDEVVSLLRADAVHGPFDEMANRLATRLTLNVADDPVEGARIGPYRLLRKTVRAAWASYTLPSEPTASSNSKWP